MGVLLSNLRSGRASLECTHSVAKTSGQILEREALTSGRDHRNDLESNKSYGRPAKVDRNGTRHGPHQIELGSSSRPFRARIQPFWARIQPSSIYLASQ